MDREKVIKGLECCKKNYCDGDECPYFGEDCDNIKADALALINELEVAYHGAEELLRQKMILFDDAIKRLKEQEAVVRCKDCIHFAQDNIPTDGCGFCELLSRTYCGNDYCSYGERKTDDA